MMSPSKIEGGLKPKNKSKNIMEARTITVLLESENDVRTISTGAETLGELKADLRANGVNYTDKKFYEGLSRVELVDDASQLPKDVNYRGRVTNDLVFTLTTINKKIKSGADRAALYAQVVKYGLAGKIKEGEGKNYTQVPNYALEGYVKDAEVKTIEHKDAFTVLVDVLYNKGVIGKANVQYILGYYYDSLPNTKVSTEPGCPYTPEELRALKA